jgi:hypothetical protein
MRGGKGGGGTHSQRVSAAAAEMERLGERLLQSRYGHRGAVHIIGAHACAAAGGAHACACVCARGCVRDWLGAGRRSLDGQWDDRSQRVG